MPKWETVREYSERNQISVTSTHKRIKAGKITTKKINGKTYVFDITNPAFDGDLSLSVSPEIMQAQEEKQQNDIEYLSAKLQKLKADTALKLQQAARQKEQWRQEFAADVLEIFQDSFQELKSELISMKMDKDQNKIFQEGFRKKLSAFSSSLQHYLS